VIPVSLDDVRGLLHEPAASLHLWDGGDAVKKAVKIYTVSHPRKP
jgi:hypothetical protein